MTKFRRFFGRLFFILGAISVFVCFSPLFPIGVEALLVGGLFFAIGGWVMAEPRIRDFFQRTARAIGNLRADIDPLLPVQILKLAKIRKGILTVSEVAIGLNLPLDLAEEGLKACVRAGNAQEDYEMSRGYSFYRFPEFLPAEGYGPPERLI
jgi:hypothetical protein